MVSPKIHPVHAHSKTGMTEIFSSRKKISQLVHLFGKKNFFVFQTKKSPKMDFAPAPRNQVQKVGQSILTDESADMIFSSRKKIMISRLLARQKLKKAIFEW